MDSSGYNLRQRPFPVLVSTQSLSLTSTTVSTADSITTANTGLTPVPTMTTVSQEQPQETQAEFLQWRACQETLGSESSQGMDVVAEPIAPAAASSGEITNIVNVSTVAAANVDFAGNVQPVASVDVNVVDSAVVQTGVHTGRPGVHTDGAGVHADLTDRALDSEVSAYLSDSPPPPTAFHYGPSTPHMTSPFASVRADSRQSRAASWVDNVRSAAASQRQQRSASRQSVATLRSSADVHSRASGRLSTYSQPAADPLVELMRSVFDNQRADAAAHAAAQRADADRREQQMQARMNAEFARQDAEIFRREQEAADKARLQMRVQQLEEAMQTERVRATPSPPPVTPQRDVTSSATTQHDMSSYAAGALQSTATARDDCTLSLPAPAPAYTQHATLSAPDSLTDRTYERALRAAAFDD